MCESYSLLLLIVLIFCNNPKANGKILLDFLSREPRWCELDGWPTKIYNHCSAFFVNKNAGWDLVLCVSCWLDFELWMLHSKLETQLLEKSVAFTRSSYDTLKKKLNWKWIAHSKISNIYSGEKKYLIPCWQRNDQPIILMVGLFEQWETE